DPRQIVTAAQVSGSIQIRNLHAKSAPGKRDVLRTVEDTIEGVVRGREGDAGCFRINTDIGIEANVGRVANPSARGIWKQQPLATVQGEQWHRSWTGGLVACLLQEIGHLRPLGIVENGSCWGSWILISSQRRVGGIIGCQGGIPRQ